LLPHLFDSYHKQYRNQQLEQEEQKKKKTLQIWCWSYIPGEQLSLFWENPNIYIFAYHISPNHANGQITPQLKTILISFPFPILIHMRLILLDQTVCVPFTIPPGEWISFKERKNYATKLDTVASNAIHVRLLSQYLYWPLLRYQEYMMNNA
jgi:hypothetical protein